MLPKLAAAADEFFVVVLISKLVQVAAVNGLRFCVFGDGNGFECVARGDEDVAAYKVDEVRSLKHHLCEPRVIVFLL